MNGSVACRIPQNLDELVTTSFSEGPLLPQTARPIADISLISRCLEYLTKLQEKFREAKSTKRGVPSTDRTWQARGEVTEVLPKYIQVEELNRKAELAQKFPKAHKTLTQIGRLGPDWDTYGASPIDPRVIDLAYSVLFALQESAKTMGSVLPEPRVVPGSGGAIQFEWLVDDKAFELEILLADNQPCYAYLLCPSSSTDTWEEGEVADFFGEGVAIKKFLAWL